MKGIFHRFCPLGLGLLLAAVGYGQDTHYWTQQPSIKGLSLGGALVAGDYENSAVYYNPAALAFVDKPHLSANADAYRFESLFLQNGAGNGVDLASRRLTLYPQMTGAMLTHKPEKRLKLAFMVLTRQSANWDISYSNRFDYDVLPQHDGLEDYQASLSYQNLLNESWIGLGAGYKLNQRWSVGWTNFVSYRNQRYLFARTNRAAYIDGSNGVFISSFSQTEELRINHVGDINKIAAHGRFEQLKVGAVLTLPSIDIIGWTKVKREMAMQNISGNINGLLYDQQRNVSSRFKTPLSISAGASWEQAKHGFFASAEYFFPIGLYKMVDADSSQPFFPAALSAEKREFLSFYHFSNPVFNLGLGYSAHIREKLTLNLGARSDVSYFRRAPRRGANEAILLSPNFNLFHLSAGFIWRRANSELGLAFNGSAGYKRRLRQLANFSDPQETLFLEGPKQSNTSVQSFSASLVLGYNYFFSLK